MWGYALVNWKMGEANLAVEVAAHNMPHCSDFDMVEVEEKYVVEGAVAETPHVP